MGTPRVKSDMASQQVDMEERVRAMETRAHHWWRDTEGGLNSDWSSLTPYLQAGWTATDGFTVPPKYRVRSDKLVLYGSVKFTTGASGPALILPSDAWPLFDTMQPIVTRAGKVLMATVESVNGHVTISAVTTALANGDNIRLDAMWWPYAVMK